MNKAGSLTVVIGLPGAGKSTYLKDLLAAGRVDTIYDDYQAGALEDYRSNPRRSPSYDSLQQDLSVKRRIALADIRYCIREELNTLLAVMREDVPRMTVECVFFENNVAASKHNVRLRARPERVAAELAYIDEHSPNYRPDGRVIPVIMG